MLIKKFNTAYMPEADRVLLKISTETSKKSSDQYQFILTRRITKKLIQLLSKKMQQKKNQKEVIGHKAKNISDSVIQKTPNVFAPQLVTDCHLKPVDEDLRVALVFVFNKKFFRMLCSEKVRRLLLNLLIDIQGKAAWDISLLKRDVKKKPDLPAKTKRILH
jgi:hypothetical protein